MKLVYNFDHFYGSGMNTFLVTMPNFEYEFCPEEEDSTLTADELSEKYWNRAFEKAVNEFIKENPWTMASPYDI